MLGKGLLVPLQPEQWLADLEGRPIESDKLKRGFTVSLHVWQPFSCRGATGGFTGFQVQPDPTQLNTTSKADVLHQASKVQQMRSHQVRM